MSLLLGIDTVANAECTESIATGGTQLNRLAPCTTQDNRYIDNRYIQTIEKRSRELECNCLQMSIYVKGIDGEVRHCKAMQSCIQPELRRVM